MSAQEQEVAWQAKCAAADEARATAEAEKSAADGKAANLAVQLSACKKQTRQQQVCDHQYCSTLHCFAMSGIFHSKVWQHSYPEDLHNLQPFPVLACPCSSFRRNKGLSPYL